MTNYIEQTSASDRIEAARKALAQHDECAAKGQLDGIGEVIEALRALITPPAVGESEDVAVKAWLADLQERGTIAVFGQAVAYSPNPVQLAHAYRLGRRDGIQSAHGTWEPEVAQRPSQEQMLRWLGIQHEEADLGNIAIREQTITREEI